MSKINEKVKETGQNLEEFIEETATKHNFTKFQVCVGITIGVLALVGVWYFIF